MEDIDFNTEEWKEKIKGKSPEEIAQIVRCYYEKKCGKEKFWSGRMIGIAVFNIILFLLFLILYRLIANVMK